LTNPTASYTFGIQATQVKGAELRAIRKRLGKTQAQLADAVGVATNTIARYERDEMRISEPIARLVRIIAEGKRKK